MCIESLVDKTCVQQIKHTEALEKYIIFVLSYQRKFRKYNKNMKNIYIKESIFKKVKNNIQRNQKLNKKRAFA